MQGSEEAPNTTLKSNTTDGKKQTKSVQEGSIPADDDNKQQNFQGQIADQRKVQLAHERVLKDGYVTVYRSRIILIGQDRAGKTSLKKSLIGLPFDSEEQRTEGIEVDPLKCEIYVDQGARNWQSIDFEEGSFDGNKYGRKEVM
ncbi:unnamed protein product [Pocillopora meandrina]|uniref:Uncharacterized protein n=1 Tax=Pocillopora meandrina TaxID=46732 RepID=A0AAU9XWP4_9CNID|nr:unnamed protein product [Pocillopora meandrina]